MSERALYSQIASLAWYSQYHPHAKDAKWVAGERVNVQTNFSPQDAIWCKSGRVASSTLKLFSQPPAIEYADDVGGVPNSNPYIQTREYQPPRWEPNPYWPRCSLTQSDCY